MHPEVAPWVALLIIFGTPALAILGTVVGMKASGCFDRGASRWPF
jgi:hypothetical protein